LIVSYIVGIIAGLASTTQGSVNARIRDMIKSPYITTLISFATAIAALAVIVLITEGNLDMHRDDIASQPAWILCGGLCGVIIVMLGIICIPVIGSARNVTLLCFGQIMAGLIIDNFGLFGAPVTKMSMMRAVGAVLVFIGIILISYEGVDRKSGQQFVDPRVRRYLPLAVLSGFACAVQVAANGTLGEVIDSSSKATLISMTSGLVNTFFIIAAIYFFAGRMALYNTADDREIKKEDLHFSFHPLMLCGGPLAVVIVGGNAIAAPLLGTGMVTILNLLGMMVSGLVIDATGFLGIAKKRVTARKVAGMVIMLAGTFVITVM
jgi:transporter family-2 protein